MHHIHHPSLKWNTKMRKPVFNKQSGFTLLEIVIALSLLVILTTLLMTSFGPWLRFKQSLDTENRLRDLQQATTAFYKANAYTIDDNDLGSTYLAGYGGLQVSATDPAQNVLTNCPAAAVPPGTPYDSADIETNGILNNLSPLQPYASSAMSQLARDGFNNGICVFVSTRQQKAVAGATVFYHTIAYVSVGTNGHLDVGTTFVKDTTTNIWKLTLSGDDKGSIVDGYQIAAENFRITNERLQRLARSYETYFNIRFLSKMDRDITVNYFYANDGSNNGDPGSGGAGDPGPTINATRTVLGTTWEHASFDNVTATGMTSRLGISENDGYDAWNRPILVDNRSSRVRAGDRGGVRQMPPFTAVFGSLLPGTSSVCTNAPESGAIPDCSAFITSTAIGTY